MTTVINTPGNGGGSDNGGGVGILIGVISLVIVVGLFFIYVLPYIRAGATPNNGSINVNLKLPPTGTSTGL